MARRPLGFGPPAAPQGEGDWSAYSAVSQAGQARVLGAMEERYRTVAALAPQGAARTPRTAQIGYNPRTSKYVIGTEEFDANDPAVIKMLAELDDLPEMPLPPGHDGFSLADVKARWQDLYDNAEVDNSFGSIARGMLEGVAGIPRGIAAAAGFDIANPYEGGADAWRRKNTSLYEQVGRTMRPTESLVGLGQAGIQAIESGLPVLAAGALGSLASPLTGVAAGVTVAGGMAAESQGDDAQARLQQQLSRMTSADFAGNAEYMALRRAGNSHEDSVSELVRRGRTTAARVGFGIGGLSGAVAPVASRFAGRTLGLGGAAGARADDVIGDNLLRALRGTAADGTVRTGFGATSRAVGGSAAIGGTGEGFQEFFETDISQGLADISAGQSQRYQMGQYGTFDDFVGGFVGGAPLGGLGGLRNPGNRPAPKPEQQGTSDASLNAAAAGVVAPPAAAAVTAPPTPRPPTALDDMSFQPDLFGGPGAFTPTGGDATVDPASAREDLRRLEGFIADAERDLQTNPNTTVTEDQLSELYALADWLDREAQVAGAGAGAVLETDPRQSQMFDLRGQPIPDAPGVGQTPDMFGRPASEGPGGPVAADPANPAGNALGLSRDRMAARYGTQPLFDQNDQPTVGAMERNFAGFEGMVDDDVAGGPGATDDARFVQSLRERRAQQEDRQAQRYEESFNNPSALVDEFTPRADAPAALAEERDQLERMLEERRAAGFADGDPVTAGIEQRLADIEAEIGPRGTQGELEFPATGQRPDRFRDVAVEPEAEPPAQVDTQTRSLFGPTGGVTPAARVPKNETLRESDRKIKAEIAEMLDPKAGRDAVWISGRAEVPAGVNLPKNVRQVRTRAGILLTTNPAKARRLQQNPARAENEAEIAKILNFPINKAEIAKSGEPAVVVEGRNKATGTPTTQMLVPESRVEEGVAAVTENVNPETTEVGTTTPEASIEERGQMTAAEATKRYNQRRLAPKGEVARAPEPKSDQQAGAVTTEVAPGRPPEERRRIITEMLAPLQRKINSKTASKSEKAAAQAEANQLLAQLDALDAESTPTQTGGRGPSKGSVQEGPRAEDQSERTGDPEGRAPEGIGLDPEAEAEEVLTRAEESVEDLLAIAREFDATLDDAAGTDVDYDISPVAVPPTPVAEGLEAPVLAAAEMTVEVEGGEAQVRPGAILDWYRKRLDNLTRLLSCVLK